MNRRDFIRSGALAVSTGAVAVHSGAEALTGEVLERDADPQVPFVIEVTGRPGTFAFCYPCDRITHGNQYVLRDGRMIRAEKIGTTRANMNDGRGWIEIPNYSLDAEVIGRVKTTHQQDRTGWHQRPWDMP